jgi:hypothetical protein
MIGRLAFTAVAALALTAGASSSAQATVVAAPFFISYAVDLPNYAVSDIVMFEQGAPNPDPNGYGITYSFAAGVGTTTLTDPFQKFDPIIQTFLMGVTSDLAGDPPGQQHLVLFTGDSFAASATNVAFGTLFPNTDETTLINDLETGLWSPDPGIQNQAVSDLFNFAGGDAVSGPNGSVAFVPGQTFKAVAFSGGQIIGGGRSFTTLAGAVPEPATWAMMLIGFAALGAATRLRRNRLAVAA